MLIFYDFIQDYVFSTNHHLNVRLASDHLCKKWLFTWRLSLVMSLVVFYFVLSFFPRDVLDEIWDCIESGPGNYPTYVYYICIWQPPWSSDPDSLNKLLFSQSR